MSFIDNYPINKTNNEKETEFKIKLVSIVKNALKKTAQERKKGLILTEEQIEKVVSEVQNLDIGGNNQIAMTLEDIVVKALKDSKNPDIENIKLQQANMYKENKNKYEQSQEYQVAQLICKNYPRVLHKVAEALNIGGAKRRPDGSFEIDYDDDTTTFILSKYDNAFVICKGDGVPTIEVHEDNKQKEKVD